MYLTCSYVNLYTAYKAIKELGFVPKIVVSSALKYKIDDPVRLNKMLSRGIVILFTLVVLIVFEPLLALSAIVILGGVYALFYRIVRLPLNRVGALNKIVPMLAFTKPCKM